MGGDNNDTCPAGSSKSDLNLDSDLQPSNNGSALIGSSTDDTRLAPFNPSSDEVQQITLNLFQLTSDDVLFDLGCGDGRLLCSAAVQCPGLKCIGVEFDPFFVNRGRERVNELPLDVSARVDIRLDDVLNQFTSSSNEVSPNGRRGNETGVEEEKDVSHLTVMEDATALYLFVLPKGIIKLIPMLNELVQKRIQEGRRFQILSYMFQIKDWEPSIVDKTTKGGCPLYYYEFGQKGGDLSPRPL
jgi:hypothetical protein